MTTHGIATAGQNLELTEGADTILMLLQRYDLEVATHQCAAESADTLYTKHRYWRALKMAGALAILDKSDFITELHVKQAITITELFKDDMKKFETALSKEPYEIFTDFMHDKAIEGKSSLGLHDLRKMKFIPTSGDPTKKMKELIHLANAYDTNATYRLDDTNIHYEPSSRQTSWASRSNQSTTPEYLLQSKQGQTTTKSLVKKH